MLGTVLVLVSLGLFVAGWRLTENDRFFLLHASRATGQVVAHEAFEREARKVTNASGWWCRSRRLRGAGSVSVA